MSKVQAEWPYREESVIGRHVQAREHRTKVDDLLDDAVEDLGMERLYSKKIEIEIGDVDWDDSRTMVVHLDTLKGIVEEFDDD